MCASVGGGGEGFDLLSSFFKPIQSKHGLFNEGGRGWEEADCR